MSKQTNPNQTKDSKSLVTLTKNELTYLEEENKAVTDLNRKIVKFRKTALAKSLMDSTQVRTDIVKKIKKWIDIIETRLFDPVVMKELDINKVMSLMKIVTMFSVKIFNQVDKMEGILKSYLATEQMVANFESRPHTMNEEVEMKKQLTKTFIDIFAKTAETATPASQSIVVGKETIDQPPTVETEDVESSDDISKDAIQDTEDLLKNIDDFIKPDEL